MNFLGSSEDFVPLFPDDFLEDIIGRVFFAWNRIPKPVTEKLETRITKLLRHQYTYDPIIKTLPFQVRRELPIDDPHTGEELGRIDLCLLHGNDEDVYFAFECKRLNVTFPNGRFESLANDYVGPDGIGCFVSQKYSPGHDCGGMIGYVFDGKIDAAKSAVEIQLAKTSVNVGLLTSGLAKSDLAPDRAELGETLHRVGDSRFAVYHLFLSII